MTDKLPSINNLSADLATASLASMSKAQEDFFSELKDNRYEAMHSALINAIASTLATIMKNHTERLKIQNKLFEEHMKSL